MKGDFSRISHDPKKHYTRVLKQQGRVDLDSDWNEQSAINQSLDRYRSNDIIGPNGFPKKGGGFSIYTHSFLTDVFFSMDNQVWAVGNDANILFSLDGGETWELFDPPINVTVNLWSICFPSPRVGWIAGDNGTILKIEAKNIRRQPVIGRKEVPWKISKQEVPCKARNRLVSIFFLPNNANKGWAVGNDATILITDDGGNNWKKIDPPDGITSHFKDIFFISETKGWIAGDNGRLLITSNGGNTWSNSSVISGTEEHLRRIIFTDEDNGWMVGNSGTVLNTSNGGNSWIQQVIQFSANGRRGSGRINPLRKPDLNDINIDESKNVWIVGDEGIVLSKSSGSEDWNINQIDPSDNYNGIAFNSEKKGCIVGKGGTILVKQATLARTESNHWDQKTIPLGFRTSIFANKGDAYVDGLHCNLERITSYFNQPNYPNPPDFLKVNDQKDLIYLDVWERHVSVIEDPDIREVALGGPDTTTRLKTIFQIKVKSAVNITDCTSDINDWLPEPADGRLTTSIVEGTVSDQPCIIESEGGYAGLDNRLYRIEIHKSGKVGVAKFKWSRDNGCIAYSIETFIEGDSNKIKVRQLGKDQYLSLKQYDWIEVLGDETELKGDHGTIAQIVDIKESEKIVELDTDVSSHRYEKFPKIRRWDMKSGLITITTEPIELEKGIQVEFSGDNFKTGDYWVFTARTANAKIEKLDKAPPMGIKHHYAKLALITWKGNKYEQFIGIVEDCRPVFPPLTDLVSFFYLGGDGQAAQPDQTLPAPLMVGVSNGKWPLENIEIDFRIVSGNGALTTLNNSKTDSKGIAKCNWTLGSSGDQQVEATLKDVNDNTIHLPITFNASINLASNIEYDGNNCPNWDGTKPDTVAKAITELCKKIDTQPEPESTFRINKICWEKDHKLFLFDQQVSLDDFLQGFFIVCNEAIDPDCVFLNGESRISRAIGELKIDVPYFDTSINQLDDSCFGMLGNLPLIVPLDYSLGEKNEIIHCKPQNPNCFQRIFSYLDFLYKERQLRNLLVRFSLNGNLIWAHNDHQQLLDANLFGNKLVGGGYIEPNYDSGDGKPGGILNLRFYLSKGE